MGKAEKFIQEHTRKLTQYGDDYFLWVTPDQARNAVEITREETIKEVCEWLDNHTMLSEKWFIEDLKKHLEPSEL